MMSLSGCEEFYTAGVRCFTPHTGFVKYPAQLAHGAVTAVKNPAIFLVCPVDIAFDLALDKRIMRTPEHNRFDLFFLKKIEPVHKIGVDALLVHPSVFDQLYKSPAAHVDDAALRIKTIEQPQITAPV